MGAGGAHREIRPMFHLVAVALLGGFLTIVFGWSPLGLGSLVLAPCVSSVGTLAVAAVLGRRVRRAAAPASWIHDLQAGPVASVANDRRTHPAALCRRRA